MQEKQFISEKPINGEEMAISRVGKELYEMLIRPYTKKQWNKFPSVGLLLSQWLTHGEIYV